MISQKMSSTILDHYNYMEVRVLKINESLFSGIAKSITVPGITGDLQILPGHESLVTVLKTGTIGILDPEGESHTFDIEHGYLEVTPEQVTVIL